jgi:hypothetical protein
MISFVLAPVETLDESRRQIGVVFPGDDEV